jgi:hypothetical protein
MNKIIFGLLLISVFCWAEGEQVGVSQNYVIDFDHERTSRLINTAEAKTSITDSFVDKELGPVYNLKIDYRIKVRLYGYENGSVSLLVPKEMFEQKFANKLKALKTIKLPKFSVDYQGIENIKDKNNKVYQDCLSMRIFKISDELLPCKKDSIFASLISNIEIKIKMKPTISLGAITIDLKAQLAKIPVSVGFFVDN